MALEVPTTKKVQNQNGRVRSQPFRINHRMLNAVAATGASGHLDTRGIKKASLHVFGTFVGTLQIKGSNDGGTTFSQVGTDITAPGVYEVAAYADDILSEVTAYTSGNITAWFSGLSD